MENSFLLFVQFSLLGYVSGIDWTCFFDGYHQCDGFDKCCPDGHICAGDACLAVGAIVGICIAVIVGIVTLIVIIYICKRQKRSTVGTVITQPAGGQTVAVVSQQYGQPQVYGGQYSYAQNQGYAPQPQGYAQPPGYSQLQPVNQSSAYPPPPPPDNSMYTTKT